jgi:hypothetical protein
MSPAFTGRRIAAGAVRRVRTHRELLLVAALDAQTNSAAESVLAESSSACIGLNICRDLRRSGFTLLTSDLLFGYTSISAA